MAATLRRPDDLVAFNSHEGITWRARALNGELLLEDTPTAGMAEGDDLDNHANLMGGSSGGATSVVEVSECRFRWMGVAGILARSGGGLLDAK